MSNIRSATAVDRSELFDLICVSLNYWYRGIGRPALIQDGPSVCSVFWEVYESLDPGCCLVAVEPATHRLMGACFYRERPTHFALGIMSVHPNYFGRGVAATLLRHITDLADVAGKPTRLVSSAINLDSYSLYTRAGFVPRALFQTMVVPPDRIAAKLSDFKTSSIRPATLSDVPAITELEWNVSRISREKDWRYILENPTGMWSVVVRNDSGGKVSGILAAGIHRGSRMLGPGVMADDESAIQLIADQLKRHEKESPVFLVPADHAELIRTIYSWGGRNVELHVVQSRGEFTPFAGVAMPTFMPETG